MMHLPSSPPRRKVTGKAFAYRKRNASPQQLDDLAVQLLNGEIELVDPTAKQAALLAGTTVRRINERRAAAAGLSFGEMQQSKALDRLIDKLISSGGLDQLMRRLDEYTRPAPQPESSEPAEERSAQPRPKNLHRTAEEMLADEIAEREAALAGLLEKLADS
jgi:hypothetical protein